jgi:AraC-like DNA-binding protein
MPRNDLPPFSLFAPPYREYLSLAVEEEIPTSLKVLSGAALVWSMNAGHGPHHLDKAADRPGGLPLMVMLPPARQLRKLRGELFEMVEEARPSAVLPHHPRPHPEEMALLLRSEPECLAGEVLDFLLWRGIWLDQETRRIIRRTVELSAELSTLSALSRGVYLSRRALGRRFKKRGLPVPSHWLQFCRLLRVTIRLQNSDDSLFRVASELGYPDGFTVSNQMERLVGVRPSAAREHLGWEWFVEGWIRREWENGGLRVRPKGLADPSCARHDAGVPLGAEGIGRPSAEAKGETERDGAAA